MAGDSVRITVTVIDLERIDFRFEPAGLPSPAARSG
jgi:hypothetical protein